MISITFSIAYPLRYNLQVKSAEQSKYNILSAVEMNGSNWPVVITLFMIFLLAKIISFCNILVILSSIIHSSCSVCAQKLTCKSFIKQFITKNTVVIFCKKGCSFSTLMKLERILPKNGGILRSFDLSIRIFQKVIKHLLFNFVFIFSAAILASQLQYFVTKRKHNIVYSFPME